MQRRPSYSPVDPGAQRPYPARAVPDPRAAEDRPRGATRPIHIPHFPPPRAK